MRVYMLWHGGSSYACPEAKDAECFDSLKDAKRAFENRIYDSFYPCVSRAEPLEGGPEAWVLFADPNEAPNGDIYPDRILSFGPRGGIRCERC